MTTTVDARPTIEHVISVLAHDENDQPYWHHEGSHLSRSHDPQVALTEWMADQGPDLLAGYYQARAADESGRWARGLHPMPPSRRIKGISWHPRSP